MSSLRDGTKFYDIELDGIISPEINQTEIKFYEEKKEKDIIIDKHIDEIISGLIDVKGRAKNIGTSLDEQNNIIDENIIGIYETDNLENVNKKIKKLLIKNTASLWCTICILIIILLFIIGWIIVMI